MDEEVIKLFLNDMPLKQFVVFYIVAIVGALMLFLKDLNRSLLHDTSTPYQFEWRYFWKGLIRVVMAMVSLFFGVAYFKELSPYLFDIVVPEAMVNQLGESGIHDHDFQIQINVLSAFGLGVGVDKLMKGLVGTADGGRKAIIKKFKKP